MREHAEIFPVIFIKSASLLLFYKASYACDHLKPWFTWPLHHSSCVYVSRSAGGSFPRSWQPTPQQQPSVCAQQLNAIVSLTIIQCCSCCTGGTCMHLQLLHPLLPFLHACFVRVRLHTKHTTFFYMHISTTSYVGWGIDRSIFPCLLVHTRNTLSASARTVFRRQQELCAGCVALSSAPPYSLSQTAIKRSAM
jgi:hypothetical protein